MVSTPKWLVLVAIALGVVAAPVTAQSGIVADLTADGDTAVQVGETVDVTFTLTNQGDAEASSGGLEVDVPANLSVESVSGDGSNQPDRFFLSSIGPGESRTVTYTLRASESLTGGESLDVQATGTLGSDGDTDSLTRTITVQDGGPEPTLSVTAPTEAAANGSFQVEYTLSNTGNAQAGSGGLDLTLSENLSVESVSGDGANQPDRFYTTGIAPGESVNTTYTLGVATDATGNATIDATGTLSAGGASLSTDQSTEIAITQDVSLVEAVSDSNGNISFQAVLGVIEAFNENRPVQGQEVTFQGVLTVIEAFNDQ